MSDFENNSQKSPIVGRTVWDIAVASSYVMGGILFIILLAAGLYFYFEKIPGWFWISIFGSLFFIPFLIDRAKEDCDLYLISDDTQKLTEYRIGRKYGLYIEGMGVDFYSNSGVRRTLLNSFNEESRLATGSSFGGFTEIDQVRDLNTLRNLTELLETTLRENRVSMQTVGIEVEKQSREIVDWALKTIYGSIIPTEISEIFGVESSAEDYGSETLEDIVEGDLIDE